MARKVVSMARKRWALTLSLIVIVGAGLAFVRTVLAVHATGAFELDGDATSQSTDDWDRVCFEQAKKDGLSDADATALCTATTPTTGAVAVAWVSEPDHAATIFTGGGSKDPQDISQWAWKNDPLAGDVLHGGLPDKDNLLHAYAVRYSLAPTGPTGECPNGTGGPGEPTFDPTIKCEVLYFGSDRYDNSGDAQQGFWFLQDRVGLGSAKVGGGTGFTGLHQPGDLLVISDFSNGGTVSTITIYKWDPTCTGTGKPKTGGIDGLFCGDANLERLQTSDAANCGSVTGVNDPFCGLVNNAISQPATAGLITLPWPFLDKTGTAGNGALPGEFYEAGVNLSKLKLAGECFSSLVSETRSSTSTTATLKDFVTGQFANCVPGMTTQASASVAAPVVPGFEVHDTATIQVTGGANPPDPTGTVTFYLCGPIATGDCSTGGTLVGTGSLVGGANTTDGLASATSPDVNTDASPLSAGRYCFRAEWPGDSNYGPASHTDDSFECFSVKDTSAITTAQNWLPNDTAHVTTGSGTAASGTVTFTLYPSNNCTGTATATFPNRAVDANGNASTNNTNTLIVITPGATISWSAVFTPTNADAVNGSTSHCETSTVTINNDIGS
jgi:hypothetical protein